MLCTVVWFVAPVGKEQVVGYQFTVTRFTPDSEIQFEMFYVSTFQLQKQDLRRNTWNIVCGRTGATWPAMNSAACNCMIAVLMLTANCSGNWTATETESGYNHFTAMWAKCTHPGVSGVCSLPVNREYPFPDLRPRTVVPSRHWSVIAAEPISNSPFIISGRTHNNDIFAAACYCRQVPHGGSTRLRKCLL
jgi:hypothetical protein